MLKFLQTKIEVQINILKKEEKITVFGDVCTESVHSNCSLKKNQDFKISCTFIF